MALISSNIEKVRAYELPCGIWANGESVGMPRIALVKWQSSWSDKFYQVYVNGQYAGSTVNYQQRQLIVPVPTSLETPVRIEVFAVEAEQAGIDFSSEIDCPYSWSGRVRIIFVQSQSLPPDAIARIYYDNGTGTIDYNNPFSEKAIKVWPAWQNKGGFGMSRFGASDFGYGSSAALGFGKSSFGNTGFGFDDDTIEWVSPPLPAGTYKFAVKITDKFGNESSACETSQITVSPPAKPAEQLSVSSFDKQTNQLVLTIL